MSASVALRDVTIAYDRVPAVHHLSGVFAGGQRTAIAGANGAGKSTLLKAIAGIVPVFEGEIELNGATRRDMTYLPQAAELQRDFPLDVLQLVCSGLWRKSGGFRRIDNAQRAQAMAAIEAVGLGELEARTMERLSAGQFQRALFARLMVQDARLILLDEPFAAIDMPTTEALLAIINQWHGEGRTVICVLHDAAQIRAHFDDCLLLAKEDARWGTPDEVLGRGM